MTTKVEFHPQGYTDARIMLLSGTPAQVSLLEADPDLARHVVDEERRAAAARRISVSVENLARGPWTPVVPAVRAAFGLLILDGLAVREATVGDHPCAELVGPGDVIRLGGGQDPDELLPRLVEWAVLSPTRVAVLDEAFIAAAAPWPELIACIVDRAGRRADRLIVLQASTHLTRVDDRLLALLWYLAERWGKVTPDGVALALKLPHRTLAGMVGARRPSVTTALGQLMARGDVHRRADGAWVLRGNPPERIDPIVAVPDGNGRVATAG